MLSLLIPNGHHDYGISAGCKVHNVPCLPPAPTTPLPHPPKNKNLHNLCYLFLLGIKVVPREIVNNANEKFWRQTSEMWRMINKWRMDAFRIIVQY